MSQVFRGIAHRSDRPMRIQPGHANRQPPRSDVSTPRLHAAGMLVRAIMLRDGRFLAVTLLSCAVAAIVSMFQYSVYTSFLQASSVVPRMLGGDLWVTAASVECFDFPTPFNEDYAGIVARVAPGARFRRVVVGFSPWRSPSGRRGNVAVVGVDDSELPDTGFTADRSDLARLDLVEDGGYQVATIADTSLHLASTTASLPTFLGAPYVVLPFERARSILRMDPSSTSFLIIDTAGRTPDAATLREELGRNWPDVRLHSADEFATSSARYWQNKTGAGLAILLAAILAGLLMTILLANGVLRFMQRYHTDIVSLLGHGAGRTDILLIVAMVAALIASVTLVTAIVATPVIILLVQPLLPWVAFRLVDILPPAAAVVAALLIALLSARRAVASFAPDIVFRS